MCAKGCHKGRVDSPLHSSLWPFIVHSLSSPWLQSYSRVCADRGDLVRPSLPRGTHGQAGDMDGQQQLRATEASGGEVGVYLAKVALRKQHADGGTGPGLW